jgi:hypothetical protein
VVQLTAGVFKISQNPLQIRKSNITLRGVGPGRGLSTGVNPVGPGVNYAATYVVDPTATQLVKTDGLGGIGNPVVQIGEDPAQWGASTNLASDAPVGAFSVTTVSPTGAAVGELVYIDQITDNDPDVFWGPNHDPPGGASRLWFMRQDRSLSQVVQVTAVNGNTLSFASPLHTTFMTAYTAQVTRWNQSLVQTITGSSIEEMMVFGGTNSNIVIWLAAKSWV